MASEVARRGVRRVEVVAVLGGSTVLAGSWIVAVANHGVPGWEEDIFERINDLPNGLWHIVWAPMQLGSLFGSLLVVAVTFVVTRRHRLTLATLFASQTAFWGAKIVKSMVSRGRPAALLAGVRLREKATGVGYVSGHTAVAFALAAVIAPSVPRAWRPGVFAVATLVAFARMYSGAHLPLDCAGGAGLGLLTGTLWRWAFGLGGEGLPVQIRD